ncbi:MAG: histone deacetylase family protein [Geminicoccaceae bacterium]|nr:histone deacetylase family protein [Geminicoccaceae bacterium]
MKLLFDERQRHHDPRHFLSSGAPKPNPEQPARIDALLAGAARAGLDRAEVTDHGAAPIAAVHTGEYLTFLRTIFERWQRIEGGSAEVIPNIHPNGRGLSYPRSAVGQAGYHMADTACPISADTWLSAYWSAQSALSACDVVLGGERAAYALSRPPGHHAFADLAGGFCFLNNSAIAARYLLDRGRRVAIVDVDLHHGNGTQGIFYNCGEILTVSIHAHSERYYPFFWGHPQERGEGAGLGANLNLPIPAGSGDDIFLGELARGIDRVRDFAADTLVIALGLDAFEGDPFGGLAVTTSGFARIAAALSDLGLATVIVQEGGYLCPELGDNLASFLSVWPGCRAKLAG